MGLDKPYLGKRLVETAIEQARPVSKIKRTKRIEKTIKRRKKDKLDEQDR